MSNIILKYNELDVDTYLALRAGVQWKRLSRAQAETALKNSICVITAYEGTQAVAMGRIVGDGAVICYVQDLIVLPEHQGQGIGSEVLLALRSYVEQLRLNHTEMMFCLMCAKGREKFYEKHGFTARPTPSLGPGMIMYLYEQ
jgi:GNAT superfamily N-acetyltransferase